MNEEVYAKNLRSFAAARALYRKSSLTASDLTHILNLPRNASALQHRSSTTMREYGYSPPSTEEFLDYMDTIGIVSPPCLSESQLVSLLATFLRNYCDPENDKRMQTLADAAVTTVIECEAQIALDCAVGPEDGVH